MKVADMHCDTIAEIYAKRQAGEECGILKNNLHIDLEKWSGGIMRYRTLPYSPIWRILRGKCPFRSMRSVSSIRFSQSSADIRTGSGS